MQSRNKSPKRYLLLVSLALLFLLSSFASWIYLRYQSIDTVIEPTLQQIAIDIPDAKPLAWPGYGQAAVGTKDYGILATHGDTEPQPTASTAKLITMLAIMTKKPFTDGKGETITFTDNDVAIYNDYVAGNGTITPIAADVQWTQYQAFQSIQINSANNISDSLAIWAFGSLEEYRSYAQAMVDDLGMKHTTIGTDASGYSPTTTSTAHDMALLMMHILDNPILRDITHQSETTLPWTGTIRGHSRIEHNDFISGKTGYIPEAGGTYVLGAQQAIDGKVHDIVVAVLGAPHFTEAQNDAWTLYQSAKDNFSYRTAITKGQKVGVYQSGWNDEIAITTDNDISLFIWNGKQPEIHIFAQSLTPDKSQEVGVIEVEYGNWMTRAQLVAESPLEQPPWWYGLKQ